MLRAIHEPAAGPGGGQRRLLLLLVVLAVLAVAVGVSSASAAVVSGPSPAVREPTSAVFAGRAPPQRPTAAPEAGRVPPLRMPLAGAVVRGFEARAGPYGPGHRGIDMAAPPGTTVRAPAAGMVVFAGPVAGTTWVSLLVAPGVVVTFGPLLDPITAGRPVRSQTPVGRVGPGHGAADLAGRVGSGEVVVLHLSLRVDGVYIDPLPYLVDRPRPRLAPLLQPGGLREP
jgi:murein DD-endopeptidase MepM/ murein hydrolase activator NlpD